MRLSTERDRDEARGLAVLHAALDAGITFIDKPLRRFTVKDRRMNWEFPNTPSWNFAGELSADGTTITV
jgi:hypothetical protein